MLKWLLTIAVAVIILGFVLLTARRGGTPRRGLPGDVTLRWRGRDYFFPFASTILFSLLFIVISRLI